MPAASTNKLPPTLIVAAENNIKWKVAVYRKLIPFKVFLPCFQDGAGGQQIASFEQLALTDILVGSLEVEHRREA